MPVFNERRRDGRSENAKFSAVSGLLPTREPRRQGVVDLLGGEEVAKDVEEKSASLFGEKERAAHAAKLDGDDPDEAVETSRKLFGDYQEAAGKSAKKPAWSADPHRPFSGTKELTDEIKSPAYKKEETARKTVAGRLNLSSVIKTNGPTIRGKLGDDLRAKGAPAKTGAQLFLARFDENASPMQTLGLDAEDYVIDPKLGPDLVRPDQGRGDFGGGASGGGGRGGRSKPSSQTPGGRTTSKPGGMVGLGLAGALLGGVREVEQGQAPKVAPVPSPLPPTPNRDAPPEAPVAPSRPKIPVVGPTQSHMDARVAPERTYHSGDPRDGWTVLQPSQLEEPEVEALAKTQKEEKMDWIFLDEEGRRRTRRLPVFIVKRSVWPELFDREMEAPESVIGFPEPLSRGDRVNENVRRRNARARLGWTKGMITAEASKGNNVHEKPMVSTREIDEISPPSALSRGRGVIGPVPEGENKSHGSALRWFYHRHGLVTPGQPFLYLYVDDLL